MTFVPSVESMKTLPSLLMARSREVADFEKDMVVGIRQRKKDESNIYIQHLYFHSLVEIKVLYMYLFGIVAQTCTSGIVSTSFRVEYFSVTYEAISASLAFYLFIFFCTQRTQTLHYPRIPCTMAWAET